MTFLTNPYAFGGGGGPPEPDGIFLVGRKLGVLNNAAPNPRSISLTDLTGGFASAPRANDLVIVAINENYNLNIAGTAALPGGTYTIQCDVYGDSTHNASFVVGTRVMPSTPDTTVSIKPSSASGNALAYAIYVFGGVDPTTPMDVTPTTATANNSSHANPPAITPVTAGALIVATGGGSAGDTAALTQAAGQLSDFASITSTSAFSVFNDASVAMGTFAWSSGSFDPTAFIDAAYGATNVSNAFGACTLALRPAP